MGISVNTASKAFHSLQAKGFIVITKYGALGVEGEARGPSYELTEISLPHENAPRKLFRQWRKGNDFEFKLHNANNPNGLNGKTRRKS